jgi:glyoxylase-like metal-dependent hydrolase (beta-lactamase superfamily II)
LLGIDLICGAEGSTMGSGSLRIGNVEVMALLDARVKRFPFDLSQIFPGVPTDAWEPYRVRYPALFPDADGWSPEVCCYLIRSGGRTILVDTGIGPGGSAAAEFLGVSGVLPERLASAGVSPDEIDTVILTHLHFDHVGWCVAYDGGRARLSFAKARHIVHRADWEAFHSPEVQAAIPFSYIPEMATPIAQLCDLQLIDADQRVTDEVSIFHTPGHTPGSVSLEIVSGGERAILWADAFVHPATVTEPDWTFSFEMDPEAAVRTRMSLLDRVEETGSRVVACHFPEPGFGSVVRIDGKRYWQGL